MQCLDVIMIAFSPRNIQTSSFFARKASVNTERVPPGHSIILLKSNKFNMAAVSVKRSISTHASFLLKSTKFSLQKQPECPLKLSCSKCIVHSL